MGTSLSSRIQESLTLTAAQFAEKYPHPWLIHELAKAQSVLAVITTVAPAHKPAEKALATMDIPISAQEIRLSPDGFALLEIVKSDRNPFEDRIMVGRAKNNDIVLAHQSVSKLHAYFQMSPGNVQLFICGSTNPTKLSGSLLTPNGPGVDMVDGASVQFGSARCRYMQSASLHALLLESQR